MEWTRSLKVPMRTLAVNLKIVVPAVRRASEPELFTTG